MKSKRIIISVVMLLALVIGVFFVSKDKEQQVSEIPADEQSALELPQKVECNEDIELDNSVVYNTKRSKEDVKLYTETLTKMCLKSNMFCSLQGFLAEVYRNSPENIDYWLEDLELKSIEHVQALLVPLNTEENREIYEKYIKKFVKSEHQKDRYMRHAPLEDEDFMIQTACHFDFNWGRYFSYQNSAYLNKIINCAANEEAEYCSADKISRQLATENLAENAKQYEFVKTYLKENLSEYTTEARELIKKEVLNPNEEK